MTTVAKDFTAVGNGPDFLIKHGESFTYAVAGTFDATAVLQRSDDGGQNWNAVVSATGAASGTIRVDARNETHARYRFRCSVFASGTVETSLADVAGEVAQSFADKDGNVRLEITDGGVDVEGAFDVNGAVTADSINFGGSTLSSYVSSSFTGTLTGVDAVVTGTVKYVKVGDQVTLDLPNPPFSGTSNAATKTVTGMPASIRPAAAKRAFAIVQDNGGAPSTGEVFIGTNGVLDFYTSLNAAGFTGSGTATISYQSFTYLIS